jgi:hypothetical protein
MVLPLPLDGIIEAFLGFVSVCGIIGFLFLITPQIIFLTKGPSLPAAMMDLMPSQVCFSITGCSASAFQKFLYILIQYQVYFVQFSDSTHFAKMASHKSVPQAVSGYSADFSI